MASPVFIGYGISEPGFGWDDYASMDVKRRWIILLNGVPPVEASNPKFPESLRKQYSNWKTRDSLKINALINHQAAGVIVLPDKHTTENWEYAVIQNYRFNYMHYAEADVNRKNTSDLSLPFILIHSDLSKHLLADQGYDPMANRGNYHSYVLYNTKISIAINCKKEAIDCYNIIANLPGTDSSLKNKYLTVGAHLDHLGKIGNHIYNGANDDASGCVIMLEAAKALALNPLNKSVLFVLYTSEEQNLIGSMHFLKKPPIPVDQILLNINIEQIGSKNREIPGIWAIASSQFKESLYIVEHSLSELEFKFDTLENYLNALSSSDLWSYYQKNIPTIMLSSGGFKEHHTLQDKIDLIDFKHLQAAAKFLYLFCMELGNKQ